MDIFAIALLQIALIPLVIIGGIAYAIYVWRRRASDSDAPDGGLGTPRRFYFYSISFIALMMLAGGVMTVLSSLLVELFGDPVLRNSTVRLATGLALTIVGAPLWALHWRFVQLRSSDTPAESRSVIRKLHLYVTLGVALAFLAYNGSRLIASLLGGEYAWTSSLSALAVWTLVWAYHWRAAAAEHPETTLETRGIRRLYLYLASALGISMLASGLGWLVHIALDEGRIALFAVTVIDAGDTGLLRSAARVSLSVAIVGAAIWWPHWFRFAAREPNSLLRRLYLFAVSVGGAFVMLIGLGLLLNSALWWLLGAADDPPAVHFETIPPATATAAVGIALWLAFRRRLFAEASGSDSIPVSRIYDLLLSALGLAALAAAAFTILDAAIRLIAGTSPVMVEDQSRLMSRIADTLTLLILGIPTWGIHWRRLQTAAHADPESERPALPRKLYVLGVLCLGVLALVGGLSASLFMFLRDLLAADLSSETLRDLSAALSTTFTALFALSYHWTVYRHDRQFEPDEPTPEPARKRVTLIAAPQSAAVLAAALESAIGYPVTTLRWSDAQAFAPALDARALEETSRAIASSPGSRVLLIPEPHGLRVISHE